MKRTCIALLTVALAGCASSVPQVAEFNGDSVKVKVYCGVAMECTKPRPEDVAQANQTCATRQRTAQFASTTFREESGGSYSVSVADHLFLCV
jgi:hypothetical protein